jgi:hypothetical protein
MTEFRIEFLLVTATRFEWLLGYYTHATLLPLTQEHQHAGNVYIAALLAPYARDVCCAACRRPTQLQYGAELAAASVTRPGTRLVTFVSVRGMLPCASNTCRAALRVLLDEKRQEAHTSGVMLVRHMCTGCYLYEDPNTAPTAPFYRCSRCKFTFYCSAACQRSDWPEHRKTCFPAAVRALPATDKVEEERESLD